MTREYRPFANDADWIRAARQSPGWLSWGYAGVWVVAISCLARIGWETVPALTSILHTLTVIPH
jgi:hypothetical protein